MIAHDLNGFESNISSKALEKMSLYNTLLCKWNKAINIVSPKTLPEAWLRHFIDSAQITQYIPDTARTYADLGCGGGFPGLVVAMMRPELDIHLIESDERKCQFMRTVARETHTDNVTIHTERIEQMHDIICPDIVSARALASLDKLFAYCLPWAQDNPDLSFVFMKGERTDDEVTIARQNYHFTVACHDSITDPSARIVIAQGLTAL